MGFPFRRLFGRLRAPAAGVLGLLAVSGCYEVGIDVIGAGEGVRAGEIADGFYVSTANDETSVVLAGWDAVAHEYSIEERGEHASSFSRIRVAPLADGYYLLQYNSNGGRYVLIAAVAGASVTLYDAEPTVAREVAARHGVAIGDDELTGPYIETTDAATIRAFFAELATSGRIEPLATYDYSGPP